MARAVVLNVASAILVVSLAGASVAAERRATIGTRAAVAPLGPTLQRMSQTLNCTNGSSYTVSTGTDGGKCTVNKEGDSVTCVDDTQGGVATANCFGGCGSTHHGGTCTKK